MEKAEKAERDMQIHIIEIVTISHTVEFSVLI